MFSSKRKIKSSRFVALIALFAALNVVSDSIASLPELPSGVWYSWNFMVEPLTGIILGPMAGFSATFIGVMIGHYIHFIDIYEFLFMLGAPLGAMFSGLLFRRKWKPVLIYYSALLVAYFINPIAWQLPIWGMWDTYLAYIVLLFVIFKIRKDSLEYESKSLLYTIGFCAFIGLEADVLFRIFIFVPCQTFKLFYSFNIETLQLIWIVGAFGTPLKVAISTLVTTLIGHPLIKTIKKMGLFKIHKT